MLIATGLALAAAGPALAADLPPPGPPPQAPATYVPVAAPVYNWGGVYIGINGGYGFGQSNWSGVTTGSFSTDGGLVGGTLGANFQAGQFVFGLETDIDWQDLKGSAACTGLGAGVNCETDSDWLGTVRGRGGFAVDRALFYATGGLAYGDVETGTNLLGTSGATKIGWTVGGGLEYGITENWTAKIEYLYVDLENTSCSADCVGTGTVPPPSAVGNSVSFNENIVRAGFNFKFNPF
jgi:outer membrane immunogenic protein